MAVVLTAYQTNRLTLTALLINIAIFAALGVLSLALFIFMRPRHSVRGMCLGASAHRLAHLCASDQVHDP